MINRKDFEKPRLGCYEVEFAKIRVQSHREKPGAGMSSRAVAIHANERASNAVRKGRLGAQESPGASCRDILDVYEGLKRDTT